MSAHPFGRMGPSPALSLVTVAGVPQACAACGIEAGDPLWLCPRSESEPCAFRVLLADDDRSTVTCRFCGCTDLHACVESDGAPCSWVEADLCSACAGARSELPSWGSVATAIVLVTLLCLWSVAALGVQEGWF